MLHELGSRQFRIEFAVKPPTPHDFALYYEDRKALLIDHDGQFLLPRFSDLPASCLARARYLFCIDEDEFFLADALDANGLPGACMEPLEIFRSFAPQHLGFAGVLGSQLSRFYRDNAFCGRCGQPACPSLKERALVCGACGNTVYPKISPAVIVGVTDGNRLVLTKYAGRAYARHALVAGFAEAGEPIEDTVAREVLEEVGLRVKNIRYHRSQPWPFSDSLLLGFFCDLDGDDRITLQEDELSEAGWFSRDELPATENTMSLTNTMIEAFRRGDHAKA